MSCALKGGLALMLALAASPAWSAACHSVSAELQSLSQTEVDGLVKTTATVARQLNQTKATIAVVDRVGNVLAVWRTGDAFDVRIRSGFVASTMAGEFGLENMVVPDSLAAIAKAVTGAYLSSSGNAFSTRTASFIVQKNFIPTIRNFPSGPLFGVQFSQLPCGDLVQKGDSLGIGPRRSPLGLSADPGGFPLYKNGRVVGGIGVVVSGSDYSADANPINTDYDVEEVIAQAGSKAYAAPTCIRADHITAGGFNLRYSDADKRLPKAPAIQSFAGAYIAVTGYLPTAAARGSGLRHGFVWLSVAGFRGLRVAQWHAFGGQRRGQSVCAAGLIGTGERQRWLVRGRSHDPPTAGARCCQPGPRPDSSRAQLAGRGHHLGDRPRR